MRAVAVRTHSVVDPLASVISVVVEFGDDARVIDVLFVFGKRRKLRERTGWLEFGGSFRSLLRNLNHITSEIIELLDAGQLIGQTFRHDGLV